MTQSSPAAQLAALFWMLRPNRSFMVASITGAAAFACGAGVARSLWMTLIGWTLAVGGFSMDLYADRHLDRQGPRATLRHNPLASGVLSLPVGMAFSLSFLTVSLMLTVWIAPPALIPWTVILTIIIGLAIHIFDTPLWRALTLGLLQALYALMGAAAGVLDLGVALLAVMFFFAMFGGRGMIDIRDYSQDEVSGVHTLPQHYGVKQTARFTAVCLLIAYALSLAAYFMGNFNRSYLYLDLVFIAIGLPCAWLFAIRPTPRLAHILTLVFMVGMGTLICLAMILGSL